MAADISYPYFLVTVSFKKMNPSLIRMRSLEDFYNFFLKTMISRELKNHSTDIVKRSIHRFQKIVEISIRGGFQKESFIVRMKKKKKS